jgi:hypothetical protein
VSNPTPSLLPTQGVDQGGVVRVGSACALQRQNTKISKQIFPEKEYRGLRPNFHNHASVSDLYIPTIGLPILLEEICTPILGLQYINRSQTHECGNWG